MEMLDDDAFSTIKKIPARPPHHYSLPPFEVCARARVSPTTSIRSWGLHTLMQRVCETLLCFRAIKYARTASAKDRLCASRLEALLVCLHAYRQNRRVVVNDSSLVECFAER